MPQSALIILGVLSLLAGLTPVLLLGLHLLDSSAVVLVLTNALGWLLLAFLLYGHRRMHSVIRNAARALGLSLDPGNLQQRFDDFIDQASRYHRASSLFQSGREGELSANLRKIAQTAYRELDAKAVQLILFDEKSRNSAQSIQIGVPGQETSELSRTILSGSDDGFIRPRRQSSKILREALSFAGTTFGVLLVEVAPTVTLRDIDREVVHLLAVQGALMLLEARFSDELLRMRRASEESVRAKTGFLANLSHEIRGPLGIILNGAELILDGLCGPITEQQRSTLNMVQNNGNHLVDLVNDVLDYAKVEAGKVQAKPNPIALHELLDDLANVVRSQAMAKKHKLDVEPCDPALGILCDKRHIRQMLINFLTNAIKYTPEGGSILIKADRIAGNRVKISVRDSGIGIPKSEHAKVFAAFERVNDRYAQSQTGTGLGMPLTRRLAEVNGGSADFDSEQGKGSTFWLVMPGVELEPASPKSTEAEINEKSVPQGKGETILIVDHELEAREMLGKYLAHQGFQIVEANSGADVMKMLRENDIQVAVVENDMPDVSGEEIVTVIRSNPKASGVPIVLLSAKAFVFDIERFLKLGVDRCLAKPVDLREIASTVRRLIDDARDLSAEPPSAP